MFSKEEALQIKKDFWIAFAEEYPRKWLLYNTKIKDVTFKFYVDNKKEQPYDAQWCVWLFFIYGCLM